MYTHKHKQSILPSYLRRGMLTFVLCRTMLVTYPERWRTQLTCRTRD